jgi:Ribbon-helix-helix protein, copG family
VKKLKDGKVPVTVMVAPDVADAVRLLAAREETSSATILRRLIRLGLEAEEAAK